jgi:streptogramin lyase
VRRVILAILAITAVTPAARADWPVTQSACTDVTATVEVWKQFGNDVLENLALDGLGNIWISNSSKGRIERWDLDTKAQTFSAAVAAPGAITPGPLGRLYVNFGDSIQGALAKTGMAGVKWLDPEASTPELADYSAGFHMANGGAFDAAGNLYASNDVDAGLVRIALGGSPVEPFSDVWGTNGLVVYGDNLYAAITFDQRSPIEQIPLANPALHSTFAELSFGAVSLQPAVHAPSASPVTTPLVGLKGLDDMTLGPDGNFYVVANGMGELLRVDPQTGEACLVTSGLQNPSSVRFLQEGDSDHPVAFITEFSGAVRRVDFA